MYKEPVDASLIAEAFGLEAKWRDLLNDAKKKDSELEMSKQ